MHSDLGMTTCDQDMTCLHPHPEFLGRDGRGESFKQFKILIPTYQTSLSDYDLSRPHYDGLRVDSDLFQTVSVPVYADPNRILLFAKLWSCRGVKMCSEMGALVLLRPVLGEGFKPVFPDLFHNF